MFQNHLTEIFDSNAYSTQFKPRDALVACWLTNQSIPITQLITYNVYPSRYVKVWVCWKLFWGPTFFSHKTKTMGTMSEETGNEWTQKLEFYGGKYGKGIELWSKTVCTARGEGRTFRFLTSGAFVRRFSFFKIRIAIDVIPFDLIWKYSYHRIASAYILCHSGILVLLCAHQRAEYQAFQ